MPEIQVKDKLITLEELGAAINAKAGVTSVNNQTGAVSITPANIGAVSTSDVINVAHGGTGATTPAGARANLDITPANIGAVAKTGDTMTGTLNIDATASEDPRIIINGPNGRNWCLYRDDHASLIFAQWGDGVSWRIPLLFDWSTGNVHMSNPLGTDCGGTGATTPDGARSNLGALGSNATRVMFGGSATNFYQNLGAEISTMTDEEAQIFVVTVDSTDGPFYQWHTYSGTIVRYANAICGGILTDQTGQIIAISCNCGTWSVRSL